MTECRQQMWAQKAEKTIAAPKLCALPPTAEAFEQNIYREHFQVSHALWNMAEGVPHAPEQILKLVWLYFTATM